MSYIAVRKWDEFQHYTDRRPPWVKLHVQTLDNAELAALDPASQLVAYKLLMIASKSDNRTTDNVRILAGWMQLPTRTVNAGLKKLQSIGFLDFRYETEHEIEMAQQGQIALIPASAPQAPRKQDASPRARPRTRGEAEAEKELRTGNAKRTEGPADALPGSNPERSGTHGTITDRLVANACRDHPQSTGVLRAACAKHTEHTLARALESLLGRRPRPTNPPGYVINTIRSIAAENGRPAGPTIDRPPADF